MVLRAQGPHREPVGVFGICPWGDSMLVGEELITLIPCAGQHPAPLWTSLPCWVLLRDPCGQMCVPGLSCSTAGGSPCSPRTVWDQAHHHSGFGFCSAVRRMGRCWEGEGEIEPHFWVASPLSSFISLTMRQLSARLYFQEVMTYYILGKPHKRYFCYFIPRWNNFWFSLDYPTWQYINEHVAYQITNVAVFMTCSPAFSD